MKPEVFLLFEVTEGKMLEIAKKAFWFTVQVLGLAFIVLFYAWFWPVLAILWVFDPGQNEPEVIYWKQKDRQDKLVVRD